MKTIINNCNFGRKLRIGFDLDGILTSFYLGVRSLIMDMYGITMPKEHTSNWNFCKQYITKKQEDLIWKEIHKSKIFWRGLPVCPKLTPEDIVRIKELCKTDDVFFITTTVSNDFDDAYEQRRDWLLQHCGLDRDSYALILADNKVEYINLLGLNMFIDDKPSFLKQSFEACPDTIIVKMNWKYNEYVKMLFVHNVGEYLAFIDKVKSVK